VDRPGQSYYLAATPCVPKNVSHFSRHFFEGVRHFAGTFYLKYNENLLKSMVPGIFDFFRGLDQKWRLREFLGKKNGTQKCQ